MTVSEFDVPVQSLAFSADNRLLAMGLADGTVVVLEPETQRQRVLVPAAPDDATYCLAFSPDRRFLLAGRGRADSYGEVLLWHVPVGAELQFGDKQLLVKHDAPVAAVIVHPGSGQATGASVDLRGGAKRWVIPSRESLDSGKFEIPEQADRIAFAADRSTVAFGCGRRVFVYDEDGRSRGELESGTRYAGPLALSPDGSLLALGWGFSVHLGKLHSQAPWEAAPLCWTRCFSLSFSDDGTILAVGGDGALPFVSLWDTRTKRQVGRFIAGDAIGCVAISPDGHLLASAGLMRTVMLWDLTKLKKSVFLTEHDWYQPFALSPDGNTVACRGPNHTVALWDTATGKTRPLGKHSGWVTNLAFSPDGKTLASTSVDGWVRLWDVATGDFIDGHDKHQQKAWSVAFASIDGMRLASGGRKGEFWWWDRTTGQKVPIAGHRQDATICCLKASPDFRFLVSGTVWTTAHHEERDNEAIVWDIRGNQPAKLGDPLRGPIVSSIGFSRDGQYFALGRLASTMEIRRLHDRSRVSVLHGEGTWMTGVDFSPDGDCVVTAGASGEIRIFRNWDRAAEEQEVTVIRTDDRFRRIEFFGDRSAFVTGGMDGYVRVWRVERLAGETGQPR